MEDRIQLVGGARGEDGEALAMRSRIVLLAGDGLINTAIAVRMQACGLPLVWRRGYSGSGLKRV